jgi:2-keto-3-deoxy-L-fuconate dehydrogenase
MTQLLRLANKRCLVTAAGAGIGRATAIAFVRAGAQVLAADLDAAALRSLAQEERAIRTLVADVTDVTQIAALAAAEPSADVLFNCAGYVHAGTLLETTPEDWRRSFTLNVDAMFHLCRAVMPGMLARGRGSIINMASVASSIKGVPNRCAYGTTKAAVIGLTRSIASDYVARGIRCNAICPGTVRTPSLASRVAASAGDPEAVWQSFIARQPMGRLGEAEEIAALAVYLASDESAFVTGTTQIIDGGWSNS